VLDVACGSGNAAIVATRRFCEVTGLDFVPELLERARVRAEADGSPIELVEGDAQAMPFPDAGFDTVMSVFGVMFAPDQARAAAELLRVCRPGGTIALANWTPGSWAHRLFQAAARVVPPPPGLAPPWRWGTADGVSELLGGGATIRTERRAFHQIFRSPDHMIDVFGSSFGPLVSAFAAVGPEGAGELRGAVAAIIAELDRARDGSCRVESEYLVVLGSRHAGEGGSR
jgi:SAM-dependent methyltransferase